MVSAVEGIMIDVPAAPRSLRLLRLAAADAAAELGMDVEEIESARIAVDELASALLATGSWERLVVVIDRGGGTLQARGHVIGTPRSRTPLTTDRIVSELLRVCVDDYRLEDGEPPSFWFSLRTPAAGG